MHINSANNSCLISDWQTLPRYRLVRRRIPDIVLEATLYRLFTTDMPQDGETISWTKSVLGLRSFNESKSIKQHTFLFLGSSRRILSAEEEKNLFFNRCFALYNYMWETNNEKLLCNDIWYVSPFTTYKLNTDAANLSLIVTYFGRCYHNLLS